jgi:hypothetical protein
MEKSIGMNNVKLAALFMAGCIFFESTAFGIKAIVTAGYTPVSRTNLHVPNHLNASSSPTWVSPSFSEELPENTKTDGGPDQPEVQSFSPIGVSDMVDPFSGDFSYNIPLMDVDGYPINIAYSAGVTMDQEASWVGLGWNLNPGVINRSMRGIPDEYNGTEKITKEMNLKRNWTIGGSFSGDYELFGFGDQINNPGTFNLNASLGVNYNNYSGFSSSTSLGFYSNGISLGNSSSMCAGLGFSGSSTGGASLSASLGFNFKEKRDKESIGHGLNIGSAMNSRGGLGNTTVGYSRHYSKTIDTKNNQDKDISSSYNFGLSTYTPSISMPMLTAGGTFSFKLGGDISGNDLSGEFSGFYTEQWLKEKKKSANSLYAILQSFPSKDFIAK